MSVCCSSFNCSVSLKTILMRILFSIFLFNYAVSLPHVNYTLCCVEKGEDSWPKTGFTAQRYQDRSRNLPKRQDDSALASRPTWEGCLFPQGQTSFPVQRHQGSWRALMGECLFNPQTERHPMGWPGSAPHPLRQRQQGQREHQEHQVDHRERNRL